MEKTKAKRPNQLIKYIMKFRRCSQVEAEQWQITTAVIAQYATAQSEASEIHIKQ
nr:hypothetical protein [Enterovibrio nigricans]